MNNYKYTLQSEIAKLRAKADNMETWVEKLEQDGFDFDNVTPTQAWAIENLLCPK